MRVIRPILMLGLSALVAAAVGGTLEGVVAKIGGTSGGWSALIGASIGLWLCVLPLLIGLAGLCLGGASIARRQHHANAPRFWTNTALVALGLAGLSAWTRWGATIAIERLKDVSLMVPVLSGWTVLGAGGLVGLAAVIHPRLLRVRRNWIAAGVGILALVGALLGPIGLLTKDMPLTPLIGLLSGVAATVGLTLWVRKKRMWGLASAGLMAAVLGGWGLWQYARFAEVRQPILARQTLARWAGLQLRQRFDADGDGRSPWFGGGDCDDTNPTIHPNAFDRPDNGIDEDCDGVPLSLTSRAPRQPETHHSLPAGLKKRWNLLFVSVDTVRADRLSLHGHTRPTSPRLDALAQNGLVFERAYSPVNSTRLAIPAFFAGRAVADLDAWQWGRERVLRRGNDLLFERLRAAGWRTEASLPKQLRDGMWFGPGWGFDVYAGLADADLKTASVPALVGDVKARLSRLKNSATPWAIWVHFLEPHEPYLAHAEYPFGDAPIDRYDAEIAAVDAGLGQLVDHLESLGLADSTLIVYTADHGEEFEEHGRRHHAKQVFDESMRVPWVVHVPGAPAVRAPAPVSLIDIPATLSNLMDVPPAPSYGGISQANLLTGAEPDWSRTVYIESAFDGYTPRAHQRGIVKWPYKAIFDHRTGLEGLYHLKDDPTESQNLRFDAPDVWRELSGVLNHRHQAFRARRLHQILTHATVDAPPGGLKGKPQRIAPGLTFLGYKIDALDYPERPLQRLRFWIRTDGEKRAKMRLILQVTDARGTRIRKQNAEPFLDIYPSDAWPADRIMEVGRMLRFPKHYAHPLAVKLTLMSEGRTIWGPKRVALLR